MKKLATQLFVGGIFLFTAPFLEGQDIQEHHGRDQQSFTSATLSSESLEAFEKRALEKVEEFYQYLSVVLNKQYDAKIRVQARKQALELFSDKTTRIYGMEVGKFLDSCLAGKLISPSEVSNKKLEKKFGESADWGFSYSAQVSFATLPDKSRRSAVIILKKTEKQFGSGSKVIWNVFLGEIK